MIKFEYEPIPITLVNPDKKYIKIKEIEFKEVDTILSIELTFNHNESDDYKLTVLKQGAQNVRLFEVYIDKSHSDSIYKYICESIKYIQTNTKITSQYPFYKLYKSIYISYYIFDLLIKHGLCKVDFLNKGTYETAKRSFKYLKEHKKLLDRLETVISAI